MSLLSQVEVVKDLIQNEIEQGATTVEEVHQSIADLPFEVLEKRGLLNEGAAQLRETQRTTIGTVYGKIREINKLIGDMASEMIANLDDARQASKGVEGKE